MNKTKDPRKVVLGERLKGWRTDKGWSQARTAQEAGVPQGTISDYEVGNIAEGALTVARIAETLGHNPGDLFIEDRYSEVRKALPEELELSEQDETDFFNLCGALAELHRLGGPGTLALFRSHVEGIVAKFTGKTTPRLEPSGDEPAFEQPKSSPLHLPREQAEAFLKYLLGQMETWEGSLPLTKAGVAIARQLAHDNALELSGGTWGKAAPEKGTGEKGAPAAAASSPPPAPTPPPRGKKKGS